MAALQKLKDRAKSLTPIPKAERLVEVGCTWINIFSVNSVAQTFEADISIRLSWKETDPAMIAKIEEVSSNKQKVNPGVSAHGKAAMEMKDFIEHCWDPQFQFPNCEDMEGSEQWVRAEKSGDHVIVIWAIRFRCNKFTCQFDLRKFPFDQQALFIRISSQWDETKVQFIASTRDKPTRVAYDDYNLPDYEIVSSRIADVQSQESRDLRYLCRSNMSSSNSGVRYNSIFLIQNVSRHPEFYVLNLYLPTFLISSSGFIAFVFAVEDFNGRATVLMTLLLTVVAFKQVITQNLPRLPYVTYMDRYALVSLALIVLIGVIAAAESTATVCVVAPTRRPTLCTMILPTLDFANVDHADHICLIVVSVLWMFYQVVEGCLIGLARRVEQAELAEERTLIELQNLRKPTAEGKAE